MKTFLPALTLEEEADYFAIMKGEDLVAANEAKQALIEHNLRLVAHVAKKYVGFGEDLEDLISVGTIGLIKAITTFQCQRGSRLGTYAAKCIDNELLMVFRTKRKLSREISLYEPIGTDKEGNEISLLDVCEQEQRDIVEELDLREKKEALTAMLQTKLTPRERDIIYLRYGFVGDELTQKQIGEMFGISRSYVSRIEKKALKKLKEGFSSSFYIK